MMGKFHKNWSFPGDISICRASVFPTKKSFPNSCFHQPFSCLLQRANSSKTQKSFISK